METGAQAETDLASPRGQAWEMTRHQAYQAQLAGHTIGETFTRAAAFLKLAVADTPAPTDPSAPAHVENDGTKRSTAP